MDQAITEKLRRAQEENNVEILKEVHKILKNARKDTSKSDPFNTNKYVICAEIALQLACTDICESCIKLYFLKTPPNNAFLCRAYLCQAQVHAPGNASDQDKQEECAGYILKAINLAKSNKAWYFIVYNASVLYMTLMRVFMKANFRYILSKSLNIVVKSLDEINDEDYERRFELSMILIEALIDAGNRDEAVQISNNLMKLVKANLQHYCRKVFAVQVTHKLIDASKISAYIKSSAELSLCYKILKLRSSKDMLPVDQIKLELDQIFRLILEDEESDSRSQASSSGSKNKRHVLPLTRQEKNELLVDLAQVALESNQAQVSELALSAIKDASDELSLEVQIMKCESMVSPQKDFIYSRTNIEKQVKAIESLSEQIQLAHRQNSQNHIQIGCVTLWNLCLPLLQINMRGKIRKALLLIADKLENIESMLWLLRCQIHIEVSKCEEDEDHIQPAIMHLLKALNLDDTGCYKVRIEHMLKKMKMKALLYQVPQRAEDHARMIIEQVVSSQEKADMCVYLEKAGTLLAPDSFLLAMEGEKFWLSMKGEQDIGKFAEKVKRYSSAIANIQGHLKHLSQTNRRERLLLWADLVKTARKQKVWHVARTAARFCLLYDTDEWSSISTGESMSSPTKSIDSHTTNTSTQSGVGSVSTQSGVGIVSQHDTKGLVMFSNNNDIIQVLADINLLYGEALVQLLHEESLKLLETPTLPVDTKKKPKKYVKDLLDEPPDEWVSYCNYIQSISNEIISKFLCAAKYGLALQRPWIVSNACIYMWNYSKHIMSNNQFSLLVPHYKPFFEVLQSLHEINDYGILCDFTNALVQGYIGPHVEKIVLKPSVHDTKVVASQNQGRKSKLGGKSNTNVSHKGKVPVAVPSNSSIESTADVKMALEILQYTLSLISSSTSINSLHLHALIKLWVLCKTILHQPMSKNYAIEKDDSKMTRALCATEAYILKMKDGLDINPVPSLNEVIGLIDSVDWDGNITLLKLWSQLSVVCLWSIDLDNAIECANKCINIGKSADEKKSKHKLGRYSEFDYKDSQKMLSYAYLCKGQSLMVKMETQPKIFKEAVDIFIQAAIHGKCSGCYDLVMEVSKHYWNMITDMVSKKQHQGLLLKPTVEILDCISAVFDKSVNKELLAQSESRKTLNKTHKDEKNTSQECSKQSENLQLQASLYCLLFQIYFDLGQLENAYETVNKALQIMPRTDHRLQLFKCRIIASAILNKPFQFDIEKFNSNDESMYAEMWCHVSNYIKDRNEKAMAYVKAIQALSQEEYMTQKIEYITAYCQLLINTNTPSNDVLEQLEYASNLLICNSGKDLSLKMHNIENITSIMKLNMLSQLFAMISSLQRNNNSHWTYLLCTVTLLKRMFQLSVSNIEESIEEGIKPGENLTKTIRKSKSSKDNVKIERSSSKFVFPSTSESLAIFNIPDKHVAYIQADIHDFYISKSSISKPTVTFKLLKDLLEILSGYGCHHFCVDVLVVMETLAYYVIENSAVKLYVHLIGQKLYSEFGLVNARDKHASKLESCMLEVEQELSSYNQHLFDGNNVTENYNQSEFSCESVTYSFLIESMELLINQSELEFVFAILSKFDSRQISNVKKSEVDYYKALIHFQMGQWGKVIELLQQNEDKLFYTVNQKVFTKRTVLLTKALFYYQHDKTSHQSYIDNSIFFKCQQFIDSAITILRRHTSNLPHAKNICDECIAELHFELASLCYEESKDRKHEQKLARKLCLLEDGCKYFSESLKIYENIGRNMAFSNTLDMYCKCKIEELLIQLKFLEENPKKSEEGINSIKENILKLYSSFKEKVSFLEDLQTKITSTCSNMGNIDYLPIEISICNNKMSLLSIMLQMMKIKVVERKERRVIEESKAHIVRVIEDFVKTGNEESQFDRNWKSVLNVISDEAANVVMILKKMLHNNKTLQSKMYYLSGELYNLLGRLEIADKINYWGLGDSNPSGPINNQLSESSIQLFASLQTQSTNSLLQALSLSLMNGDTDIVFQCSYKLLECVGLKDPITTLQILSIFQSASTCLCFKYLLRNAFNDMHMSASASCFEKNFTMKISGLENKYIEEQSFSHHLCVMRNHFDILKDTPFPMTFVILQHSPEKDFLYCGVMEKSIMNLSSHSGNTKPKNTGESQTSNHIVCCRTSTNQKVLNSLLLMIEEFKETVSNHLVKKSRINKPINVENPNEDVQVNSNHSIESMETKLERDFETLIMSCETYLGDIVKELQAYLEHTEHHVILLCDAYMMQLPLEALGIFKRSKIKSLSRDFSLQCHWSRFQQAGNSDGGRQSKVDNGKTKGGKGKGEKPQAPAQTKGAKDVSIDKDNIIFDMSNLKYLINPTSCEKDGQLIESSFDEIMAYYKNKTSKWTGHRGPDINKRDIQMMLNSSSAFIFNGHGKLTDLIRPQILAPIDMSECKMALILDKALSYITHKQNIIIDSSKCRLDKNLEKPVNLSMILSLCGIGCFTLNQWCSNVESNNQKLKTILTGLFENGETLGSSMLPLFIDKIVTQKAETEKISKNASSKKRSPNRLSMSDNKSPPISHVITDDTTSPEEKKVKHSYEDYNLVLYGLPNFMQV